MKKILLLLPIFCLFTLVVHAQDATPVPGTQPVQFFYTYHQPSGNRIVEGTGAFPNVPGYDISLQTIPAWVVGAAVEGDIPRWLVRDLTAGVLQIVRPEGADIPGLVPPSENSRPATALPVLAVSNGAAGNVKSQDNPTNLSHPIPLRGGQLFLQVTYNGDVALWRGDIEIARLYLNALRDARPVVNRDGLIALYTGATNQRYVHGVLGDDFEAASLVILNVSETEFGIVAQIDLEGEDVFEGIAPFWADINADGTEDLVTTMSNSTGTWIRVFPFDGTQFSETVIDSPSTGQANRWRHQLAFGAFGPAGENELVAVRTPHLGGIIEFFRYNPETNTLDLIIEQAGYTSHVIGNINMDMVVGGDFNGDGQLEMILLSQDRTRVISVQHTTEGVREMWALPAGSRIVTNMSAVTMPDGSLALAYGTEDGRLRVWLPNPTAAGTSQ
jgi:hypothetical protein